MSNLNRAELCDLLLAVNHDLAETLRGVFELPSDELVERLRGTSAELDQIAGNAMKAIRDHRRI